MAIALLPSWTAAPSLDAAGSLDLLSGVFFAWRQYTRNDGYFASDPELLPIWHFAAGESSNSRREPY